MKQFNLAALFLRLRLAAAALGAVTCFSLALALVSLAALLWLVPQFGQQAERHKLAMRLALMPAPAAARDAPASANDKLLQFYDVLGEKRYAEQQVKTLFGIAAKAGLSLSQGEYKGGYDKNGRLHTYQVTLPVKGSYRAIWQFGLNALLAIPFASLDEISFKRETVTDATVEARLRLTLYLADKPAGALP